MPLYQLRKPNPNFPAEPNRMIEVTINYRLAGRNWATGQSVEGGYYINVVPIRITNSDGCTMKEFEAFSGYNRTIVKCERRSNKKVQEAIDWVNNNLDEILKPFTPKSAAIKNKCCPMVQI